MSLEGKPERFWLIEHTFDSNCGTNACQKPWIELFWMIQVWAILWSFYCLSRVWRQTIATTTSGGQRSTCALNERHSCSQHKEDKDTCGILTWIFNQSVWTRELIICLNVISSTQATIICMHLRLYWGNKFARFAGNRGEKSVRRKEWLDLTPHGRWEAYILAKVFGCYLSPRRRPLLCCALMRIIWRSAWQIQ